MSSPLRQFAVCDVLKYSRHAPPKACATRHGSQAYFWPTRPMAQVIGLVAHTHDSQHCCMGRQVSYTTEKQVHFSRSVGIQ